jgi:probable F420-dependent oxidoreductase
MKFGVAANMLWQGPPIQEIAQAAEDLGFESLWMGQHVIIPLDIKNPVRHGVPLPDTYRHMPDPFIWLTAAATATTRLNLGLNICLIAQHNPLNLAKQVACLDRISLGRVLLGIGAGWIEEEAGIMGVPFKRRWSKAMEHARALKVLWTEEAPSFSGEFVSFPPVYSYPKPLQVPHPPILIGAGNHNTDNAAALRRIAESDAAGGWLPNFLYPAQMRAHLDQLRDLCEQHGRDFNTLDITLLIPGMILGVGDRPPFFGNEQVTPGKPEEMIAEYEAAGVGRILVGLVDFTQEVGLGPLEQAAKGLHLA